MEENRDIIQQPVQDGLQAIRGIGQVLAASQLSEALERLVQELSDAMRCEHIFLSFYDPVAQVFRSVAWRSPINPGEVAVDQKFMGTTYASGQPAIVHDLSQYNYRLRPAVARLGLMSMIGMPIMVDRKMIGVMEAFSKEAGHFSDVDVEVLSVFARQAGALLERNELERDCRFQKAEAEFLLEALKMEQASAGSMFYRLGEVFAAALGVTGIAVFGLEPQQEEVLLQEVMAQGFSMSDITRLKNLYTKEYLQKLAELEESSPELPIVKQTFKRGEQGGAKLLYIAPVMYRRVLSGIVVFYWQELEQTMNVPEVESFIRRMIGHMTIVLSRKQLFSNIHKVSFYDLLTGLANRRLFDYVLERELKKMRRTGKPLSLLMVDIDFFKTINDVHGHLAGDNILGQMGRLIWESFRGVDLPARYGGEEFGIILPETDRDAALAVAERLRTHVEAFPFNTGSKQINVTVSVGGATYLPQAAEAGAENLIRQADMALYQAKKLGRNLTIFQGNQ